MTLDNAERRKLVEIEHRLAIEDPALAARLSRPLLFDRRRWWGTVIGVTQLLVGLVLLILGVALDVGSMLVVGLTLAMTFPTAIGVAVNRSTRTPAPGSHRR